MRSSSAASSSGRSTAGSVRGRLGDGIRSAGFCAHARRARAACGRRRAARRACARPSRPRRRARRARRRSGAASAWPTSPGLEACAAAPQRELAEVDAVGAARLLGHAAAAQVGVEERQRLAPGARSAAAYPRRRGSVLHRHGDGSGRHPAPARRGGRRRRRRAAAAPWHRDPGPERRLDACGTRCCAGGSGASSSARSCFDTPTAMPCSGAGLGGGADRRDRRRSAQAGPRPAAVESYASESTAPGQAM